MCHNVGDMKITNIKREKKQYLITLENGNSFKIFSAIKDEFNLYINKDIDENLIEEIKKENEIQKYFDAAIKKLKNGDCSPNKLKEFLIKKGAKKGEANKVIAKLSKYSLLNEDELIKNVISFCDSKHYGYNRIISMLIARDVSRKKIDDVKYDLKRERHEAQKQQSVLVRRYKNKNNANLKRSVYASLIRLGFNEEIASFYSAKTFNSTIKELNMLKLDYQRFFSSYSRKLQGKDLTEKIFDKLMSRGYMFQDIKLVMEELNNEMG